MFTTRQEVMELVAEMDAVFASQDIGRYNALLKRINRDGGWNGGDLGDVVQAVADACAEARTMKPAEWPPGKAASVHAAVRRLSSS